MLPKTRRNLKLESLENRNLLSATTVESEPNNAPRLADEIAFDPADHVAELHGEIRSRGDRDFFHFIAPADGEVHVTTAPATGSSLLPKLQVTDAARQKLFETQPNHGTLSGSFQVTAGQSIFLRMRTQDRTVGEYVVQVSLSGAPDTPPGGDNTGGDGTGGDNIGGDNTGGSNVVNEREPNNRRTRANVATIDDGGQLTLQGVSTSKRDKDYFVLEPTASGTVHVEVQPDGGETAKIEVKNAVGIELFESEPNDGINAGTFEVTAGEKYFLRLRSPERAPAPYLVDVALNAVLNDNGGGTDDNGGGTDDNGGGTDDNGGGTDDNGGDVTPPVGELQLEANLAATAAASRADGKGSYEHRSDRVKLSVEVEDLSAGMVVVFQVNGSEIGRLTTNALGTADLNLDSRLGDTVPVLAADATVEVLSEDGTLLLSGTFSVK